MEVAFTIDGIRYEAELLARGPKNCRVGWLAEDDVPKPPGRELEQSRTRPGWVTMLLPVVGPGAITIEVTAKPQAHSGPTKRALGPQTANLAKDLARFVQDQALQGRLRVVCSHRGAHQEEDAERDLLEAGVDLRQIAFFMGAEHTAHAKVGAADIVVTTRGRPPRIILLIEVEECIQGSAPKTIIGDALLPVLADRVDLCHGDGYASMQLDGAHILIGYHPRRGYDVSRTKLLEVKFNQLLQKTREAGQAGAATIQLLNTHPSRLRAALLAEAASILMKFRLEDSSNVCALKDTLMR